MNIYSLRTARSRQDTIVPARNGRIFFHAYGQSEAFSSDHRNVAEATLASPYIDKDIYDVRRMKPVGASFLTYMQRKGPSTKSMLNRVLSDE
jgi:hypothetical protein